MVIRGGEREVWEVCSLVLESIIYLNRMNDDNVNMEFGRERHGCPTVVLTAYKPRPLSFFLFL